MKDWSRWWRDFLGTSLDRDRVAIEILRQRYVEEMQAADRFNQHAQKMYYTQFHENLLDIATDKSKYGAWIGDKIIALGGKLPEVSEYRSTDENNWRYLQMDLAEENRCADHLPEQIWRLESAHPEIGRLLQQIFDAEKKHRHELNDMLMRSDGFARSLA